TFRDGDALVEKNLLKPDAVVGGDDDALSLRIDLSDFPKGAGDAIVNFLNLRVADLKEKKPGETQAQADFRVAALGRTKSVAAAVVGGDSATATRVTLELPEGSRKGLTPVIDEGVKKMLA